MDYIIIGTDHNLQKSDSADSGLRDLLQKILQSNLVVLIAEEVRTDKEVHTFGRGLVGDKKWLSIDMTKQQKIDAGIYDTLNTGGPVRHPATGEHVSGNFYHLKSDGVKETFWLDKIKKWCSKRNLVTGTVVITCGHNHLWYLASKAATLGHTVTILEYLPYDKEAVHGIFTVCDD